jgi:WhiB family redox-sensing transcriptional regulator
MGHSARAGGDSADWRDGAACRRHDPELFFPEGTAGPAKLQAEQAKRVCQSCPARTPCLDFALRVGLAFGIWGGTTGEERSDIRHALARLVVSPGSLSGVDEAPVGDTGLLQGTDLDEHSAR